MYSSVLLYFNCHTAISLWFCIIAAKSETTKQTPTGASPSPAASKKSETEQKKDEKKDEKKEAAEPRAPAFDQHKKAGQFV